MSADKLPDTASRPIGVFDSGMGGLTVMRALIARLPQERFIYLGDTARLPYGTKSGDTVTRYALQAARTLARFDVKLMVVACNTASASALPALKASLAPIPALGVIEPGAEAALAAAEGGPIAIIATEGTVRGGAYVRAIQLRAPETEVVQQACPLFVPLAEEGWTEGDVPRVVAEHYLAPVLSSIPQPKCLVLGCTHFPVLANVIGEIAGPAVILVDSAVTTANAVARLLEQSGQAARTRGGPHRFLVTDAPDRFARVGEIFLGAPIDPGHVELVDIQE